MDINELQRELKEYKDKYPLMEVSYFCAKDKSNKGYIINVKQGKKLVYSTYQQ